MDNSNSANPVSRNKEVFKDLANIFYKLFTILAALVAVKSTDAGDELFTQHYTACVLAIVVFFLVWVLHTLLQHPITIASVFPIGLQLLLGCVVSFSMLKLVSQYVAKVALALWIIICVVVVIFNHYQEELRKLSTRTRQLIESYMA